MSVPHAGTGSVAPVGGRPPLDAIAGIVLQANGTTTGAIADGAEDLRVMLTVGVLVVLAVVAYGVRLGARRAADSYDDDRVRTVESAAVTGLIVAAAGVVLVIWQGELQTVFEQFDPPPLFGVKVVVSLLVTAAAYGLTKVAGRVVKRREPGDERTPPSVDHRREVAFYLIQVGVYVLATLVVVGVWGVGFGRLENLLVGAGFLGIVLGLAARQTLAAVLAGFVLLFARPFEVGDWVLVGEREGIVTEITVFNTRLRTFDDEHVVIPNDRVTSRDVINRSREGRLRVTQEVGVDYDADVGHAAEVARGAVEDCDVDPLLSTPAPRVVAKGFGDSAVVLELRYWITAPTARRMWRTRTAVTEAVKAAFQREGIAIPFPQRTLSGRADDPVGVEGTAGLAGAPPPAAGTDGDSADRPEASTDGESADASGPTTDGDDSGGSDDDPGGSDGDDTDDESGESDGEEDGTAGDGTARDGTAGDGSTGEGTAGDGAERTAGED